MTNGRRVRLDRSFPARYEVEVLEELPASSRHERVVYYPGASLQGGRDGLWLRISPEEVDDWIGVFARGFATNTALTGVFTAPEVETAYVVSRGEGYGLVVTDHRRWFDVNARPIEHVVPLIEHGLIVFGDRTNLVAYGEHGEVWVSDRIASDGLRISSADDDVIVGQAWSAAARKDVEFVLDVRTGQHTGGV